MIGGRWTWIALAALATSASATAVAPLRVTYDLRQVTTNAPVVVSPTGLLVPLRPVSRALGGQMRWDGETKTAVVQYRGRRLEVDQQSRKIRLDGRPLGGGVSPRAAQGQLLVPLAAIERLFGVRGRWQPQRHLLSFAAAGGGNGPAQRENASKSPAGSGLVLLLSSDRRTYPVGTPVRLTLAVTNGGRAPVTLQFSSGQKYDFEVRRAGQTVWRWSADRMFTQALTSLTLAPGERKSFSETWKQQDNEGHQVPTGEYEAIATLTTMTRPQPQSPPLTVRIGS